MPIRLESLMTCHCVELVREELGFFWFGLVWFGLVWFGLPTYILLFCRKRVFWLFCLVSIWIHTFSGGSQSKCVWRHILIDLFWFGLSSVSCISGVMITCDSHPLASLAQWAGSSVKKNSDRALLIWLSGPLCVLYWSIYLLFIDLVRISFWAVWFQYLSIFKAAMGFVAFWWKW